MDRRLAGLAGTGTQAVEYPKRLSGTGDSRRNRFCDLSVLCWKAFAELWAPGGVVEEIQRKPAASTAGPFCKMEVNKMQRQPSCCDFCGFRGISQVYPTGAERINWYACLECARLVDTESWDHLIQRSVVACAQMRQIPEDKIRLLRRQMEQLVKNFRVVRLAAA